MATDDGSDDSTAKREGDGVTAERDELEASDRVMNEAGERPDNENERPREELRDATDRLEAGAEGVAESFDQRAVDLLSWLLDTETRARIYVFLRRTPGSTSEEVADGTGLYPSTVREALAELHEDDTVTRKKRQASGAGNNPYEYDAIAPSQLVDSVVEQVQNELNTVFNLDRHLGRDGSDKTKPVTISVGSEREQQPTDWKVDTGHENGAISSEATSSVDEEGQGNDVEDIDSADDSQSNTS